LASNRAARIAGAAFAVVVAVLANGCSSFQDESTIIDLRVLAIMAEPPEIYPDPAAVERLLMGNNPLPTDDDKSLASTVTALVLDPAGQGRAVSYAALACPREIDTVTAATGQNGIVCAHDDATTIDLLDPPGPQDSAAAGIEHDIIIPFAISLNQLAGAFRLDPQGAAGFQLPIAVQLELAAGSESVVSTKRVIFAEQLPDRPLSVNHNPLVTTVTYYPTRDAMANPIAPTKLAEKESVTIPLGGEMWFEPGGAIAEPYSTREATHDVPPQIITKDVPAETLRYAFLTTAGTFSPVETSSVALPIFTNLDHVHIESQYTAPSAMPADANITIWIVVRDERGGASWTTRHIVLAPP
jgi:hypothetical protein